MFPLADMFLVTKQKAKSKETIEISISRWLRAAILDYQTSTKNKKFSNRKLAFIYFFVKCPFLSTEKYQDFNIGFK